MGGSVIGATDAAVNAGSVPGGTDDHAIHATSKREACGVGTE